MEKIRPNSSLKQSLNKFKTASKWINNTAALCGNIPGTGKRVSLSCQGFF